MKIIDRPLGITTLFFLTGALVGFVGIYYSHFLQQNMLILLQYRLIGPVQAASTISNLTVFLLIVANNTLPVLLSFLYPILLGKIHWTPPLSRNRLNMLLSSFSKLCGFLIGFFDLGGTLTVAYVHGGQYLLNKLIGTSWLHGPLEFIFVLLAVAEPLRLAGRTDILSMLRKDAGLMLICVMGLLLSAGIEVYLRL